MYEAPKIKKNLEISPSRTMVKHMIGVSLRLCFYGYLKGQWRFLKVIGDGVHDPRLVEEMGPSATKSINRSHATEGQHEITLHQFAVSEQHSTNKVVATANAYTCTHYMY